MISFLLYLKWQILISSELTVRLIPSPGNDDWSPLTREEIHIHWSWKRDAIDRKHKSRRGRASGQPRSCERADAFLSRKWSIGPRKAASLSHSPESNWPERIELVPGSRRGGQKEVEDGVGARQDTRGRFLSLSFRSGTRAAIFSNSATLTRSRPYSERFSSRLPHRHVALVSPRPRIN